MLSKQSKQMPNFSKMPNASFANDKWGSSELEQKNDESKTARTDL